MDYSSSYSAQWRVFRVNRATWADAETIDNVDAVEVTKTADGDLLESGSMDVVGDLQTDYYRIVMTAVQGGDVERVDVATLLFDITGGDFDYNMNMPSADGFSVLYPASTTLVVTGAYAPAGADGAAYVGDMLANTINAPVEVEGSFTLNENIVHEIGEPVLDAAWAVLNAGDFVIQIDGRGVVHIRPKPEEPSAVLDNSNARFLANGISYTRDISEIPNRYICIVGNHRIVAVNDDENSEVSTVNRGYYVDVVDESPTPVNGETVSAYAERMLRSMSVLDEEHSYTREWINGVNVYSVIRASLNGLDGDMRVIDQSITCDHGVVIEETVNKEVSLW